MKQDEKNINIFNGIVTIKVNTSSVPAFSKIESTPILELTISESAGRSANVAFWNDDQSVGNKYMEDQFHGLSWSFTGKGLLVNKLNIRSSKNNLSAFGVAALWLVTSEASHTFSKLGNKNAMLSVELEVGCQGFGIFQSINDPSVFSLIEIFDGEDSFNKHLETKHFIEFIKHARPRYIGDRSQTIKGIAEWK